MIVGPEIPLRLSKRRSRAMNRVSLADDACHASHGFKHPVSDRTEHKKTDATGDSGPWPCRPPSSREECDGGCYRKQQSQKESRRFETVGPRTEPRRQLHRPRRRANTTTDAAVRQIVVDRTS